MVAGYGVPGFQRKYEEKLGTGIEEIMREQNLRYEQMTWMTTTMS
jgi:hypothetical protein